MHQLTIHSFTEFFRTGAIILFTPGGIFIKNFMQTDSVDLASIYLKLTVSENTVSANWSETLILQNLNTTN